MQFCACKSTFVLMCMWFLLSVVSFCKTTNSSSNIVYIDSRWVPKSTNITCFCTVDVNGHGNVSALVLDIEDQLEISPDNNTFTNFTNYHVNGNVKIILRYTTYEQRLTTICLKLEGNSIQVSCQRVGKDEMVQASTTSTDPHSSNNGSSATTSDPLLISTPKNNKRLQNGT